MGNRDFCEFYEYGSSNKDTAGILNAYCALDTMLNARNAIGSKPFLLFHDYVDFLAVLILGEVFANFRMVFKWSQNL